MLDFGHGSLRHGLPNSRCLMKNHAMFNSCLDHVVFKVCLPKEKKETTPRLKLNLNIFLPLFSYLSCMQFY